MSVALRTILIWLLALALPAQGLAAATLSLCGPGRQASAAIAAAHDSSRAGPAHHAGRHAHAHAAQAHSSDAHAGHGPAADAPPAGPGKVPAAASAEVDKRLHADEHRCSACASCCTAAVIPSNMLSVAEPAFAPTVFLAVVPAVEKFAASGPDRPPRVFLV